ncbi:MAG: hypothetical protein HZA06_02780 [Nitrospirae bacterium]|nr:hypothetical protein [Nitrospirota bacterium]
MSINFLVSNSNYGKIGVKGKAKTLTLAMTIPKALHTMKRQTNVHGRI